MGADQREALTLYMFFWLCCLEPRTIIDDNRITTDTFLDNENLRMSLRVTSEEKSPINRFGLVSKVRTHEGDHMVIYVGEVVIEVEAKARPWC